MSKFHQSHPIENKRARMAIAGTSALFFLAGALGSYFRGDHYRANIADIVRSEREIRSVYTSETSTVGDTNSEIINGEPVECGCGASKKRNQDLKELAESGGRQIALDLIKSSEGFRPVIYDPLPNDGIPEPTIAYGHLVKQGEKFVTPMSPEDGERWLESDADETGGMWATAQTSAATTYGSVL